MVWVIGKTASHEAIMTLYNIFGMALNIFLIPIGHAFATLDTPLPGLRRHSTAPEGLSHPWGWTSSGDKSLLGHLQSICPMPPPNHNYLTLGLYHPFFPQDACVIADWPP
jgi:hypothetical protein